MNQKVVFFDIDGTLLNSQKQILDSTKMAISRLKENGIIPFIATGRPPFMFEWVRRELDIQNYVSINGQYVVLNGAVIFENTLDKEAVKKLTADAETKEHYMAFYNQETYRANYGEHLYIKESFDSFHMECPGIDKEFHLHHPVHQGILFCPSSEEEYYKAAYPGFDFIRWHRFALDVLPKGSSKLIGILAVLKTLKVDVKDSYAFGDGLNDFAMIKNVGNGIVMDNGHPDLKNVAKHVTESCDNDGILKGLQYFKLID
jgi:Cof subfamily protein (haloacid dehalogenase superfamily)